MANETETSGGDRARPLPSVSSSSPASKRAEMAPKVSVVVPTHHRPDLLVHTLRSIVGQTVTDIEVIVVIDGDDEQTVRSIESLGDDRLRTVTNREALGVSRARNRGLREARGPWIAFCDDDDLWAPSKLEEQLQALKCTPGARWCATSAVLLLADGTIGRVQSCPDAAELRDALLRQNIVPGGGSGVLADRALAIEIGGFDGELSMFADWDMWLRLAGAADIAVVTRPLVASRCHPASMSRELSGTARELALLSEKHAAGTGAGRPVSVDRARTWCLDRATEGQGRREGLTTLRDLRRSHHAPAWWTVVAAGRLVAPRRLRRLAASIGGRPPRSIDVDWVRRAVEGETPPSGRSSGRLHE